MGGVQLMSSAGRESVSQLKVKHKDHLTLRLSYKAALKRIPDLDYPKTAKQHSTPGGHAHMGARWHCGIELGKWHTGLKQHASIWGMKEKSERKHGEEEEEETRNETSQEQKGGAQGEEGFMDESIDNNIFSLHS